MDYISCPKRKNKAQIHVTVCEKKCRYRGKCRALKDHNQPYLFDIVPFETVSR